MSREAAGFGSRSKKSDALGLVELLAARRRAARAGKPGPRRHGEPRELEHRVGLLPGEEVANWSAPITKSGSSNSLGAEQVDRARVRVEPHVVVGERRPRELEPVSAGASTLLVARRRGDEHDEPRQAEVLLRRPRDRDVADVRRIERAAEEAAPASRPLEHLVADLDLVAFARAGGLEDRLELLAARRLGP